VDSSKKEYMHYDPSTNKMGHKLAFPLPPPPKMDKSVGLQLDEDKNGKESTDEKLHATFVISVQRSG
jgi:hypothetical protein